MKCRSCKKEMKCLFNGVDIEFNGDVMKDTSGELTKEQPKIMCGNGDLYKCECGNYAVTGFDIIIGK